MKPIIIAPSILLPIYGGSARKFARSIRLAPIGFTSMSWMGGSCRTSRLAPRSSLPYAARPQNRSMCT